MLIKVNDIAGNLCNELESFAKSKYTKGCIFKSKRIVGVVEDNAGIFA